MPDATCSVDVRGDGVRATFDAPQWAPTPGQYLVLYDGDVCIGGGGANEKFSQCETTYP